MRAYDRAWLAAATPDFARGLRGGVVTLVPFYLAAELHRHELAWMALGGWLGTLADPGGLRSTRAKTLGVFALAGGLALSLAELAAPNRWLAALLLAAVAFAASLLRSLGAAWSGAGTMIAIVVAIGSASQSAAPLFDGAYFALGSAAAMLLSSVIWPVWMDLPLRRAEAGVFEALAGYAEALAVCFREQLPSGDPRWSQLARERQGAIRAAIEEARRLALGGRSRRAGETRVGANLRVLLGLAESQLPLLITLHESSELERGAARRAELLARLAVLVERNHEIAVVLRTPNLRHQEGTPSLPPPTSARGPSSSLSALFDHLDDASQTALDLSMALDARAEAAPGLESPERGSRRKHLLLVWRNDWLVLRDACSPRSTFFHHGARVAVTIGLTSIFARYVTTYPQWVTVTTLAVLQPHSGATTARAAQRVVGTVLGSVLAVVIELTLRSPVLLGLAMFPLSVAAVVTQRRNYRLFTFFLTPVFVLHGARFAGDWWTAVARSADSALGGAIALFAAVVVFPSRERTRLPQLLARLLVAVADYARAVLVAAPQRRLTEVDASIASARRDVGLALGDAEGALERLLSEPLHDPQDEELSLQLITYCRRAAAALTTLDTYAARGLGVALALAPEQADAVAEHFVGSLQRAARAVQGEQAGVPLVVPELPESLDPRAREPLARLLRGAGLIADAASGARFGSAAAAKPPRPFYPNAARR